MNNRWDELRQLTWARLLLFVREPEAMFWVFLFPVVLSLVLGIAFKSRKLDTVPVGVVAGQLADRWYDALQESELIEVRDFPDAESAERKLRSGALAAVVEGSDSIELRYDPTRPESETARLRIDVVIQTEAGQTALVEIRADEVDETGSRYIDFLLPGLLGMNLMGTGIWGTGFAIVEMRQKKLLKLFTVTPMNRSSFLLAQMLSRLVFLVVEVLVIVLFGVFVLDVPFRCSVFDFAVINLLGAACFSGLGLLVATRAQTIEGVSGLMNFVMMPMWLLSGIFFSYEKFPEVMHPLIRLIPLTALNDGLRGMMLEGEGLTAIPMELAVLAAWTLICFFVALRIFRWR